MHRYVIYGDFNCPFSALASTRAALLTDLGRAQVEWRAVEHDRSIPSPSEVATPDESRRLRSELAQIRALLLASEPDLLHVPRRPVNTRLAIEAYAAGSEDPRLAVRQQLFSAYWHDGADIGDPLVVEAICGSERDPETVDAWRASWRAVSNRIVPALVSSDGHASHGVDALYDLAELISD